MGRNWSIFSCESTIFDDQRQVLRQHQDFGRVNASRMSKPHMPPQDRGAAEVHLASLEDDGLVKRKSAELVVFAEEYPKQNGVTGGLHGSDPFEGDDHSGKRETDLHREHV